MSKYIPFFVCMLLGFQVAVKAADIPDNLKADYDAYIQSKKEEAIEKISREAYSIEYTDSLGGVRCKTQSKQNPGRVVQQSTSFKRLYCLDGKIMCTISDSELSRNSSDLCFTSIWDQTVDKVKLHQDALAYAKSKENEFNQLNAKLEDFWNKEQPLLDTKIQEGKILKIKELYLGMNIDVAYRIIPDQLKTDLALGSFKGLDEGYIVADQPFYSQLVITADGNKQVTKILLSGTVVDVLFNVSGVPAKEFAQKFADSYKISHMDFFAEENNEVFISGWRWVSKDGFKLILTEEKEIILEKISTRSEMKFD